LPPLPLLTLTVIRLLSISVNFRRAVSEDNRKIPLAPRMPDLFHRPFSLQRRSVEKLEPGNIEPERALGQVPLVDHVKHVLLELGLPQFRRGTVKVFCQVL